MDKIELAKGERMPQTPEQFARMAEKYEKALLREKEENSRLRAKFNKLNQKYLKAKQEQREKDAKILLTHKNEDHDSITGLVAKKWAKDILSQGD